MITRAARGRTGRVESAYGDSCAIRAISRWATSNADMRWLASTWIALPSGSSTPPSLQLGLSAGPACPALVIGDGDLVLPACASRSSPTHPDEHIETMSE